MSILENKLDQLIARDERVSPGDVTIDFIHQRREAKEKSALIDLTPGEHGGHDPTGLEYLSPAQMEAEEREADAFLARFAAPR